MSGALAGRADPVQPWAAWPIAFAASVRTSGRPKVSAGSRSATSAGR